MTDYNAIAIEKLEELEKFFDEEYELARERVARWNGERNTLADRDFDRYTQVMRYRDQFKKTKAEVIECVRHY